MQLECFSRAAIAVLLACTLFSQTHAAANTNPHLLMRQEEASKQNAVMSKVRNHQALLLEDNTSMQPSTCANACTFNVQISMLHSQDKKPKEKTLQVKGCKDEKFNLGGCSLVGGAAEACINEENSPKGVRQLKSGRGDVVGYGSCCRDDVTDSIKEMSTAFCHGEGQTPTLSPMSREAIENSVSDNSEAGDSTWTWNNLREWPTKATSMGQEVGMFMSQYKSTALLGACFSMTLVAIACSAWLMYAHFQAGMQIIPGLHQAHQSSETVIGLLWGVPVFGILGLLGLLMSELAMVWQFMQALLVASALRKMPDMFVQSGGGRLQLQRGLQAAEEEGGAGYVHIFTQLPFCFLRPCIPAKKPTLADINDLTSGVFVLCMMLPVLSFVQMIISLEAKFPENIQLSIMAPGISTFVRMMEVMFISMAMSALRGIGAVVHSLNPKAFQEASLSSKQTYCQTFVGGLRLLPIMVHIIQSICGEGALQDNPTADATRSTIVCTASLACALLSLSAFPASTGKKFQGSLKAGLEQVKFCPFCGSADLELEQVGDSASCPQCFARHVPTHLVVHRGGAQPASLSSSSKLGASDFVSDMAIRLATESEELTK